MAIDEARSSFIKEGVVHRDLVDPNFVYYDEELGDNPLIDTDILAVNTLVHLYQNPELIKVSENE